MTLDRISGPKIHPIGDSLSFPSYHLHHLSNQLELAYFPVKDSTIIQLTFTFEAGLWHHPKKLVSSLTNRLLKEGTSHHSAAEIAEWFEYHGASFNTSHDSDFASVNLYCLKKHLDVLLPWLAEVILQPSFPESELTLQVKLGKESLKQESEKTEFIAGQKFGEVLYGTTHPYGRVNSIEDYDNVKREDLISYHQSHYQASNCKLFIYGAVDNNVLIQVEKYFGQHAWPAHVKPSMPNYDVVSSKEIAVYIEKENAVQTSIRIGNHCINGEHEDYHAFKITGIVLGGYFGSRLMSSIREEKGYTYGIHAGIVLRNHGSHFRISTEVGKNVREEAVHAIFDEIKILQNEAIETDELDGVRNYMLGNYIDQQSNFFHNSSMINHYFVHNKKEEDYYKALEVLRTIKPIDIQNMANKHFNIDQLKQVLAG
jgi:predicted Zn-dependent peptidase